LKPVRLVVAISGRGRNLEAIIQAVADGRIPAQLAAVVSNRADAAGLSLATAAGVPTIVLPHVAFPDRDGFDLALAAALRGLKPDFVALAGFMRILGADLVSEFEGRMVNIHPSLLPRHKGLRTHEAALREGDAEHGATVHFVTPALDDGARIIQGRFSVRPEDDAETLAERTMQEVELKIYPQALAWLARGDLRLEGALPKLRGRVLNAPLELADLEEAFL